MSDTHDHAHAHAHAPAPRRSVEEQTLLDTALADLDAARQNLNVARSLWASVRRRDPLLGDKR